MTPTEDITNLALHLRGLSAQLRIDVDSLPSGAVMLDVHFGNRLFVLAFSPTEGGFGVDEVKDGEGLGTWYNHWFESFEPAKLKLLEMLQDAGAKASGEA